MAEEEIIGVENPDVSDNKRKLEDLEIEKVEDEQEKLEEAEPKRPRLEDNLGDLAAENGHETEKVEEPKDEISEQQPVEINIQSDDAQQPSEEPLETVKNEELITDDHQTGVIEKLSEENPLREKAQEELSKEEFQEPPAEEVSQQVPAEEVSQQVDVSSVDHQPAPVPQTITLKMEVPNTKVGVLIGKSGDTIRYLQLNSGARIQITRDIEADPNAPNRPVELIGTLENVNKAERLIKDVIAEADAGGSPALVARGFNTGASEQVHIQVPNEKVGVIIGKGGENIKNLQTRSGARIQLIPQHLSEGDLTKERTVRVTGDKKQIEMARELIKEIMNQPIRPSSGGYNQQGFRPRGPASSQWTPRGDQQQRGSYPSQNNPQYPPNYNNYPPQQQAPPRNNFGWEQRPPPQGGYDYYSGPGPHAQSGPPPNPVNTLGPGPSPTPSMGPHPAQPNYNYGQPQTPYSQTVPPYSQTAPPQSYGQETHTPQQYPYSGPGLQPAAYPQQSYGVPQGIPTQSYGQPRANQPGDGQYQAPISSAQSYGSNVQPQQPYPVQPMPQTYPQQADMYNQPPAAAVPTAAGQPFQGYGPPVGQQPGQGYAQVAPTGGYGQYPTSQTGYTEQVAQNNAGYGYQAGPVDPAYGAGAVSAYGAPPAGQVVYGQQPGLTQPGYDQTGQQAGGYGSVPVGYGTQMYGAQR